MFIAKARHGYDRYDAQYGVGLFLLLLTPDDVIAHQPLRAMVRHVRLGQCGQFMMGTARIGGKSITVSGAYGHDGLPLPVPRAVYDAGVPVPPALEEAWNKGGGWNSAGAEGPSMRQWARDHLAELRRAKP